MRRPACRGDDHLEPARLRGRSVLEHPVGSAVRRHDPNFVWYAQLREQVHARLQVLEIGFAAHDHADPGRVFSLPGVNLVLRPWICVHGTGNKGHPAVQLKSGPKKQGPRCGYAWALRARAPRVGLEPTTTRLT